MGLEIGKKSFYSAIPAYRQAGALCIPQSGTIFGEHDCKRCSLAEFAFDFDLSLMEVYNFLDEGETDSEPLRISEGLCFFLKMACENFLQRLMGDSDSRIGNADEDRF